MSDIECFFDCSSPWTYFACHNLLLMEKELGIQVAWRPILVGGVFNTVNPSVYESRERPVKVKARYYKKDLQDWAHLYKIKITDPSALVIFPVNSVKAMRGAFVALEHGKISAYSRSVFETYWGANRDISKDDVLRDIVRETGLDESEYFSKIAQPEYKDKLKANTDELIERGGFGSPTMFADGAMYFGNDRLALVEHALVHKH
jgi:2-hydroxychromene-2-carboxylate isomerase